MSEDGFKFLKPVDGKGPKEGADVAVFEKGTTGKQIVAFWIAELEKAAQLEKEVSKSQKKEADHESNR